MRQPTPTLPITAKMLRHFAVVTLAITACIGVFAQGENAKLAAQPKQGAAQESGDFGGANRALLSGGDKAPREVNGMKLASGTRLDTGGGSDVGDTPARVVDGIGYIQNSQPAMRPGSEAFSPGIPAVADLAPPEAAVPIPKDANGVPAPGAAGTALMPAKADKPKPPRRATQQDIDRMMAASSQRSGKATTD